MIGASRKMQSCDFDGAHKALTIQHGQGLFISRTWLRGGDSRLILLNDPRTTARSSTREGHRDEDDLPACPVKPSVSILHALLVGPPLTSRWAQVILLSRGKTVGQQLSNIINTLS